MLKCVFCRAWLTVTVAVAIQALLACSEATAADATRGTVGRVRERAEELVEDHSILGMAIGIVDGERITKIEVGEVAVGGPTPNGKTLFEIGSISKTFTGILLADAVVRGEVTLNEPVAKLLGPQVRVPKYDGRPIRLEDLATHSSGLPRLPTNLRFINPLNPYAHYQREQLEAFLSEHKLARAPGKEYEYSNFGMGLLGYALAERAGKTYQQLLVERICRPLRLPDTRVKLSKNQQARLATGISPLGLPTMNWDFPTLAGAGGIRSTLNDMLVFLQANMYPGRTPLAEAIRLSHKPRFVVRAPTEKDPREVEIGLGWHINTPPAGVKIVWHNGMTGGYASYVGFVPKQKIGIVVLGNTATRELDDFAVRSLKQLAETKQGGALVGTVRKQ